MSNPHQKEIEEEHYRQVLKGGAIGGALGLGLGVGGVMLASRRYPAFRSLTLPFRTFLVTSTSTFGAIVNADRTSFKWERARDPRFGYKGVSAREAEAALASGSSWDKFMRWGRENRYSIVFVTWLAGMGGALSAVGRDKYLSTAQKVVQARVYAQGLTVAILLATAMFEMNDAKSGSGRWETVMVPDPNDPEHKQMVEKKVHREAYEGQDLWKDMVAAEERRLAQAAQKKTEEGSKAQ